MAPRASLPVILMLLPSHGCKEPPAEYHQWADGIRGVADVVPGESYVGTDTHYVDQLEPEFVEDIAICTVAVEATREDARDDCYNCIFAFEVHFTADPAIGCERWVSEPPYYGYGLSSAVPPVLMILFEASEEWYGWEGPLVTVAFDGTHFTFDHFFESAWDNMPE